MLTLILKFKSYFYKYFNSKFNIFKVIIGNELLFSLIAIKHISKKTHACIPEYIKGCKLTISIV